MTSITQTRPSSRILMIAIFLYAASSIKFFDRDPLSSQVGLQGPIELATLLTVALVLFVALRRNRQRLATPSSAMAFLAFGVIAVAASPFSFYPSLSFAKGLSFLLVCAVAILACSTFSAGQVLKYVYYSFTIILAIELIVKLAGGGPLMDVDDYSARARLGLFGLHPTLLGEVSSITLLSGFLLSKRPPLYCQVFLFAMAVASGSRTGSTVLLVAVLATLFASVPVTQRLVSLYCSLAFVLLLLLLVGSQLSGYLSQEISSIIRPLYGDTLSQDVSTVSGRTDVWDAAAPALGHSVVLGYGLGGARDMLVNNTSKHWIAGDAHNAFVELALGGGLPALLVFLFGWAGAVRRAWRSIGPTRHSALILYAFIAVFGLVAPDLTNQQALGTFLIIVVDAMVCGQFETSRSQFLLANFGSANQQPFENPACT